jgi:Mn2+/Fe2+ NRAMP family transporter
VVLGAFLKYLLTEGLARWQLATGETLLEGVCHRYGRGVDYFFLAYLLVWSVFVSGSLMSACGVAFHAILPWMDARQDKILYGAIHSAVAVALVRWGGYRLFEKVMSVCIGIMFVTVVFAAIGVAPDWPAVAKGLFVPRIPDAGGKGLGWTIALMGGVGGTLTVICYGYWIREEERTGAGDLKICRIDLASGYIMTAVFGIGMVILGSRLSFDDGAKGAELVVRLADVLEAELGSFGRVGRWAFLLGAWGAVFSSLLGVWQSIPYLFADFLRITKRQEKIERAPINVDSPGYKLYLYAMVVIPVVVLLTDFQTLQKYNAILGALVMPMLALALLLLNGRKKWVGEAFRNSRFTNLLLGLTLLFFAWILVGEAYSLISPA